MGSFVQLAQRGLKIVQGVANKGEALGEDAKAALVGRHIDPEDVFQGEARVTKVLAAQLGVPVDMLDVRIKGVEWLQLLHHPETNSTGATGLAQALDGLAFITPDVKRTLEGLQSERGYVPVTTVRDKYIRFDNAVDKVGSWNQWLKANLGHAPFVYDPHSKTLVQSISVDHLAQMDNVATRAKNVIDRVSPYVNRAVGGAQDAAGTVARRTTQAADRTVGEWARETLGLERDPYVRATKLVDSRDPRYLDPLALPDGVKVSPFATGVPVSENGALWLTQDEFRTWVSEHPRRLVGAHAQLVDDETRKFDGSLTGHTYGPSISPTTPEQLRAVARSDRRTAKLLDPHRKFKQTVGTIATVGVAGTAALVAAHAVGSTRPNK